MHHQVFVRNEMFEFSPLISVSSLNTTLVKSNRVKELGLGLDMNIVTTELIENAIYVCPYLSVLSSVVLTTKYSILHKIAITNWLPRLHLSSISKDLDVLLYVVGTGVSFDMANVIFQLIVSYAEIENTVGVLPFLSLIYELLKIQKDDLDEDAILEVPRKSLKISNKVYTSAHVLDVDNDEPAKDIDSTVTEDVENRTYCYTFNHTKCFVF